MPTNQFNCETGKAGHSLRPLSLTMPTVIAGMNCALACHRTPASNPSLLNHRLYLGGFKQTFSYQRCNCATFFSPFDRTRSVQVCCRSTGEMFAELNGLLCARKRLPRSMFCIFQVLSLSLFLLNSFCCPAITSPS